MGKVLSDLITIIGTSYSATKKIYDFLGWLFAFLVAYKTVYFVIGIFFTRRFKPAKNKHKYGILIAARNEKYVIGNLLDSIAKQDYPKELLKVFVVADNCTDNTAEIARSKGAICYERFDNEHKTKGFALQFLLNKIEKDYGRMNFDGFFVFDADNLLKSNYITKMNDAFDSGEKIITSYRNTKNFDENWVASTYALHWIRSIRTGHRARSVLRLATNIQGTGFLFSSEIVRKGWNYTSLTEDRALTADAVAQGYMISYQDEAEFFDEQPTSLKIALRQRLRWSKGHLLAFVETAPKLLLNIFFGTKFLKVKWSKAERKNKKFSQRLFESIRQRFASFDILMLQTPFSVFNIVRWLIVVVIIYSCYTYVNGINNFELVSQSTFVGKIIYKIFNFKVNVEPGYVALGMGILLSIWARLFYRFCVYFGNMWIAIYLFIVEDSRIIKIKFYKKILFVLTWPIFDIIGRYTTYVALFKKVTWKQIPHESKVTIDDLNKAIK